MWQPNRAQWSIIWSVAVVAILFWPPAEGRSLIVTAVNWAVDPANTLPALPAPLPPGLGDDGDAVAAHDALETDYYRLYNSSPTTRWRMDVKASGDPFDPTTERQVLIASAAIAALAAWRLTSSS